MQETASQKDTPAWWEPIIGLRMISARLVRCLQSLAPCAVAGTVAAFLTPANAMLSVELGHLADILDSAKQAKNVSSLARTWSARISDAVWNTTVRD